MLVACEILPTIPPEGPVLTFSDLGPTYRTMVVIALGVSDILGAAVGAGAG